MGSERPGRSACRDRTAELEYLASVAISRGGDGIFLTLQVVFATKTLGISAVRYGWIASLAGVCGLVTGLLIGRWSDSKDPFTLAPVFLIIQGLAVAVLSQVHGAVGLAGAMVVMTASARGTFAIRSRYLVAVVGRERLVEFRALVRSVTNGALAVGAGAGGLVLGVVSPGVLGWAILACSLGFLIGAAVVRACGRRVLASGPAVTHGGQRTSEADDQGPGPDDGPPVTRNPVAWACVLGTTVLFLVFPLLSAGIPLWMLTVLDLPTYLVSGVLLVNTLGIVLLQVPLSRSVRDLGSAAVATWRSGLALAGVLSFIGASVLVPRAGAIALIALALGLHLLAEAWLSAAVWELAFSLAPGNRLGEYQAAFNAGADTAQIAGPTVFGYIVAVGGAPLWLVLAAAVIAAAHATRRALASAT